MTQLEWDAAGERIYQNGTDRGVLYLPDGSGVVWNGLTSVTESRSSITTSSFYTDGVKYLDFNSLSDYVASLKAFTYPDEFEQFDGYADAGNGLLVADQPITKRFGLSYRTQVNNDTEGTDYGYKIHLLYNLIAKPDDVNYISMGDTPSPIEFGWTITGKPVQLQGFRPSVHYIVNAFNSDAYLVSALEAVLYGSVDTDARFPSIDEVLTLLESTQALDIVMDGGTPSSEYGYTMEGGAA